MRGRSSRRSEVQSTRLTVDLQALDVAASTRGEIYGTAGRDLADNADNSADSYDESRVAAAARGYVVVWTRRSGGPLGGVWAAFVDAAGTPSATIALATRKYFLNPQPSGPDVVGFADGHAVVVYSNNGHVVARTISGEPPPRRRAVTR